MSEKWTELISASTEDSVVVDLPSWISRTALDAIGLGEFAAIRCQLIPAHAMAFI